VEFYSEFQALEVKRHTLLTDKMRLCYFELSKLPKVAGADDELRLWLSLFKAKTEEDLRRIEILGVPIMGQAIEAYRHTKATKEFEVIIFITNRISRRFLICSLWVHRQKRIRSGKQGMLS
jgi:hypothetical protein